MKQSKNTTTSTVHIMGRQIDKYREYLEDLVKSHKKLSKFQVELLRNSLKSIEHYNRIIMREFGVETTTQKTEV
jgi:hypothetical protein